MKISLDIDDVVCDFINPYLDNHNRIHGTSFTKLDIKSWDIWQYINMTREEFEADMRKKNLNEFYRNLPMIPGAFKGLNELIKRQHLIVLCSARSCFGDTYDWVTENDIKHSGIYLSKDKSSIYRHVDLTVDDGPHNIAMARKEGIRAIIFDQPWNRDVMNDSYIRRAYNWQDVLKEVDAYERETQKNLRR